MIMERIKQFIDYKGINVSTFERSIGMSNASFGKSLKNGGTIGSDKLENILNVYSDLSPAWLLTGEGNMLLSEHGKTESVNSNNEEVEYWRDRCKDAEAEVMRLRGQIQGLEMALRIIKGDVPSLKKCCRIVPLRR